MSSQTIISADSHIDIAWLATDLFEAGAPAAFRERVPRLEERPEGKVWTLKGRPLMPNRVVGKQPRGGPNFERMAAAGLYEHTSTEFGPTSPRLRRQHQALDGIDGEVVYGLLMLDRLLADDPEALRVCYRAYYGWVDEFGKQLPGRLAPVAPLVSHDPEQAAADLRHVAKLGLKGVEVRPGGGKPVWHHSWEPVWLAAAETGLPVHFHSDIGRLQMGGTPEDRAGNERVLAALTGSVGKMANAEHLGAMILSGVMERHPKLTLVMGECDLSWIPHFLRRMDYMASEREHSVGLPLQPSDYWYRQCRVTFQTDPIGIELIHHLGVDNVMWGNDYPHPDGVWPISSEIIAAEMGSLPEADRRKILHDNAAKLYGFESLD
jgi:uncharacterized protein